MDKPDDKAVRTFTIEDVREDKLPSEEIMQSGAVQEEEPEDEPDIVVGEKESTAAAPAEAETPAEDVPAEEQENSEEKTADAEGVHVDETPTEQLKAGDAPEAE